MRNVLIGLVFVLMVGCARQQPPVQQPQPPPSGPTAMADPCAGRTDFPCTLPLWNPDQLNEVGQFTIPERDNAGNLLQYGAGATGFSEDGTKLYVSCFQDLAGQYIRGKFAMLSIPALGGVAQVVANCAGLTTDQLKTMSTDPDPYFPITGGIVEQGGQVCVFGYITYDASNLTTRNVWCGPSLSQLQGPFRLRDSSVSEDDPAQVKPGFSKGGVSRVPPVFQPLLGGDAIVTSGYTSIIGRASYGPAAMVFNVGQIQAGGREIKMLLGCPYAIPQCVTYGTPQSFYYYNGSELGGLGFFVEGTRTYVVIEREASGPTCYGYATRDQSLHGTPYPTAANPSPENVPWCYSLSDPLNEKGPKGYPYRFVYKLYDVADLALVKTGVKKPWDIIRPYMVGDMPNATAMPGITCGYESSSCGAYHPQRKQFFFITQQWPNAVVKVYGGFVPAQPWTAPLGLPTPSFGITQVAPAEPSPWTSAVSGFYFVCPTCAGATDTSNPNGTPTRPRVTLPSPIPAGAVVRLKGRQDGLLNITAVGTATAPVFVRGLPEDRPALTREVETRGSSYLILEHLTFPDRDGVEAGRLVIPGYSGTGDHIVIRDSEFTGNINRAGGLFILGGTQHVALRNRLHDMGNLADTGDQDSHCMAIGGTTSEIWVVDNEMARCSGDGLQINAGFNNNDLTHHLYIGRNFAHGNKQAGIWSKNASDVIISQNRFEDTVPSSSSTGACSGAQYGPQRVWWLFNTFERCGWGISIQSTSGLGNGTVAYMIGNRMIGAMDRAVSLWPDSIKAVSVVNNTADASPLHLETRSATHTIENNVATGVLWPNGQGASTARANVAPGQPTTDVGVVSTAYAEFQQRYGRSIAVDANGQTRPQGAAWDIGAIEGAGSPPPPPVDCVVAWGPYLRVPGSETACVNDHRTYRAERTYTIVTPPSNGGQACPAQPERQVPDPVEGCTVPPPPPPDPCTVNPVVVTNIGWPGTGEGTRQPRFTWSVAGEVTTLKSFTFDYNPSSLSVTDARGCTTVVFRQ